MKDALKYIVENAKPIVFIILAATLCYCIVVPLTLAILFHVGDVSPDFRTFITDTLKVVSGAVLLWLGQGIAKKDTP